MEPYEIICAPYTLYLAPYGTAFPDLSVEDPTADASGWVLLGTSGNKSYTDTGVTVTTSQTIGEFTGAGSTAARKAWRTAEGVTIAASLADLSVSAWEAALDAVASQTAPGDGVSGDSHMELLRGIPVKNHALLVKGISPVSESLSAQFEIVSCYQGGNPAPVFSKANPSELACEFHLLETTLDTLGTLRIGTAAPTS